MFRKCTWAIVLALLMLPALVFGGSRWNNNNTEPTFNERNIVTKTASYTATMSDGFIKVTTSTANLTITLPAISALSTNGLGSKGYKVLKTDATGYHVIVSPSSTANTIDGTTGYRITKQNDFIVFSATAGSTNWKIDYADDVMDVNVASGAVTIGGAPVSITGSLAPTITLTGQLMKSEVHTVTDTLTQADCGKVHFLSHASTAIILTLPAPIAGCEMKFVTALAFSDQHEIRTPSAGNIIYGTLQVNAADVVCTVEDSIEFADTAETVGDFMELISDGTAWLIQDSIADTAAAIACTT
jgi:hypothetical protein